MLRVTVRIDCLNVLLIHFVSSIQFSFLLNASLSFEEERETVNKRFQDSVAALVKGEPCRWAVLVSDLNEENKHQV